MCRNAAGPGGAAQAGRATAGRHRPHGRVRRSATVLAPAPPCCSPSSTAACSWCWLPRRVCRPLPAPRAMPPVSTAAPLPPLAAEPCAPLPFQDWLGPSGHTGTRGGDDPAVMAAAARRGNSCGCAQLGAPPVDSAKAIRRSPACRTVLLRCAASGTAGDRARECRQRSLTAWLAARRNAGRYGVACGTTAYPSVCTHPSTRSQRLRRPTALPVLAAPLPTPQARSLEGGWPRAEFTAGSMSSAACHSEASPSRVVLPPPPPAACRRRRSC